MNINSSVSVAKALGLAIQQSRSSCGFTLTDMVDKLGMSYENYLRYEEGIDYCSLEDLESIVNVLDISLSDLFVLADEIRFR